MDSLLAMEEAGELRRARESGALPEAKRATLAQVVVGAVVVPAEGLIVFKSVGTALQDLSLAERYYRLLGESAGIPAAPGLACLKKLVRNR
jgi:ornithine cyclodeaminase/alanine dehydrogenase-like protein (mu-crystallin family)